ncbi:MAG: hypothetical protein U5Q16_04905 [Gammaproteobacteria bacterium]|nr:hypothetical protein [Gammaproteobacteria bacterium]
MRRATGRVGILGCLLLAAAGCAYLTGPETTVSSTPAEPPADNAPTADAAEPATDTDALNRTERQRVEDLLDRAARAIQRDHLTYPAADSALDLYDQVRLLDPDNEEARRGRERIVERYVELALGAAGQGRFTQGRAMLDRARLVDPEHPGIAPAQAQIDLLTHADRHVISLDGERVRNRDTGLQGTLRRGRPAPAAAMVAAPGSRHACYRADGRWIYQQMAEASGGARIQAELDIGSPPRVEVLCFPEAP